MEQAQDSMGHGLEQESVLLLAVAMSLSVSKLQTHPCAAWLQGYHSLLDLWLGIP